MKIILSATLLAAIIFLIIDIIWLSFAVKSFYRPNIGHLLLDKPVMWAAILFYLIYIFGLSIVIISPALSLELSLNFIFKSFATSASKEI